MRTIGNKVYVNWDDIYDAVTKVSHKLLQAYIFDEDIKIIYALGRGGMVPARLLSGRLHIKKVGFIHPDTKFKVLKKALVVDDIFDTGGTFDKVQRRVLPDTLFAFLFLRQNRTRYVDNVFHGTFIDHKKWLVFPWENPIRD